MTHRTPAPYAEYKDNRTAAEIRRDMALLRLHDRYASPTPTPPATPTARPSRHAPGLVIVILAILALGWLLS